MISYIVKIIYITDTYDSQLPKNRLFQDPYHYHYYLYTTLKHYQDKKHQYVGRATTIKEILPVLNKYIKAQYFSVD